MLNTLVNGKMGRQRAREHSIILTVMFSKGNLNRTKQMVLEYTDIRVAKHMKEAGSMIYKKVKAQRSCKMEAFTKANSTTG